MRKTRYFGRSFLTAGLALMICAGSGLAGELPFTIITSESSLTITALDTTTVISSAQTTATLTHSSAVTQLTGTVGITVGSTITFGGDTTFYGINQVSSAAGNPLLYLKPSVGGGTSSAPADVGLGITAKATDIVTITLSGPVALRNLASFLISGPVPITGTTFASNLVSLGISAGEVDYSLTSSVTTTGGSATISGSGSYTNSSHTAGSVVVSGLTTTVTLPISLLLPALLDTLGADVGVEFGGQIVMQYIATAVPEPGTLTLMSVGTVGLLAWARARRRRGNRSA